jgi:hypothetical protein
MTDNQGLQMHALFLANEGTSAVGFMAVAMAVAFLMVVGLGAYVLYCDAQNRAGERRLAGAADGESAHPVSLEGGHAQAEPAAMTSADGDAAASESPARKRRSSPPQGH